MEPRSSYNPSPNPVVTPVFRATTLTGPSGQVQDLAAAGNPELLLTLPPPNVHLIAGFDKHLPHI